MSRLTPLDKALLAIFVPLWTITFTLSLSTAVRDVHFSQVMVSSSASATDYPSVVGFRPYLTREPELRPGDALLRLGERDLRGVNAAAFQVEVLSAKRHDTPLPVVFEREGRRREGFLPVGRFAMLIWPMLPVSLAFALVAILGLLRAPLTTMIRAAVQAMMCIALIGAAHFAGSPAVTLAGFAMIMLSICLVGPLVIRALQRFPLGRPPESAWARLSPWLFAPFGLLASSSVYGYPLTIRPQVGYPLLAGYLFTLVLCCLWIATQNYGKADAIGRRQMKWILFGIYAGCLPLATASALTAIEPRFTLLTLQSFAAVAIIPICVVVAITRYNLFDIDRLLSATASYNIVLVLLVGAGLIAVPRIAEAGSELVGIDASSGQIAISLLLAAVLVPAHRRLRPVIDRVFFRERYAFDHGIAELLATLSHCRDAPEVMNRVGEGLCCLLQPEACVVYAAVEESWVPVFVEGRAVPPAFGAVSPLIGTLAERRKPLALGEAGRQPDEAPLGPFDRAALETLEAEVVVPVRLGETLAAFLCLGRKRSGDVYTSTDLSHIASVAETITRELRRFDQDEVIREGREMQESLRRYVPGAIAEQLSSGAELVSGEREVTVLFVDIRGYTSFAESRGAEEIFSAVNRYTETVSEIVRKHGGSVVEFNGDGMMTVFGAPRELASKENAAVSAGREIAAAVGSMPFEDAQGGQTKLSVGVGIATGEAFVGNIQAVDRMIWSAIGNTTNLAARLQSLTRELDSALVIDRTTWKRAQAAAEGFEARPGVPIRGRRQTQDVYALPMRSDW